jgi:Fe-S cluster assembly iron-binding protein IscA
MSLHVTEQASEHLRTLLDSQEHEDDQVIRLAADTKGTARLVLDTEKAGDQVVEHRGGTVLVIEKPVSEGLSGVSLDVKDTPNGRSFTLTKQ